MARARNHGPYLIEAAKNKLGASMEIVEQDLGKNPATGEDWKTVD
jgi:hypothetical protein